MNPAFEPLETSAPAGGQTQRLPGSTRAAALHDQLYRYAEDLQEMADRHDALEKQYEALRESSARLEQSRAVLDGLMQSSRDIHIVTDGAGRILVCNPASAALAPPQRLAGGNLQDWVLPAHHARVLALMSCAGQSDGVTGRECELHLCREDPAAPLLIVSALALAVLGEGEVRRLHWIMRDITLLRVTEFESLISSVVQKSVAEGVMVTDIEGEILAVNRAFSQITGYGEDEVIGRSPRLLGPGLQDESFYTDFWRALRENSLWQGEVSNRRKNGEIYPVWMTVNAARDADGSVLAYIAVFADLTRLREAENRLADLAWRDTPVPAVCVDRLSERPHDK
jgi:PAS domain S-box-containing protein